MKRKIQDILISELQSSSDIYAAWLGGSAATNEEDELSDTDLLLITKNSIEAFLSIENILKTHYQITHIWKETGKPGFDQRFYILKESPETYYLDIVISQEISPQHYREYFNFKRHGSPVVLFDKLEILKQASKNPKLETPPTFDKDLQGRFEIIFRTFLKEASRKKFIDSYTFYIRLVTMLVQFYRFEHSPQKHDFALRYVYKDLPPELASEIEELLKVTDISMMIDGARKMKKILETKYCKSKTNEES